MHEKIKVHSRTENYFVKILSFSDLVKVNKNTYIYIIYASKPKLYTKITWFRRLLICKCPLPAKVLTFAHFKFSGWNCLSPSFYTSVDPQY